MAGFIPQTEVMVSDNLGTTSADFGENPDYSVSMALEDVSEAIDHEPEYDGVVDYVTGRFKRSKDKRLYDEQRWIECYKNFRGLYDTDVQFTDTEKSQAFIKITKTKVLAAYAQIIDVLFSGNKFPITVRATPDPTGVSEKVNIDVQKKKSGTSLTTRPEIQAILGPLEKKLEPVREEIQIGAGTTPTSFTWEPAKEAAMKMEKRILDQIEEAGADKSLRHFAFDMALFGTGVFKGPFIMNKEYPKWDKTGAYTPIFKKMPDMSSVSIWNSYPDADARNMQEAEYFIERHRYSKSDLRKLKKRPFFRAEAIDKVISFGPNYINEYWEDILNENDNQSAIERWEVLEFWGYIDSEIAEESGFEIPEELEDLDQIPVNIWISGDRVLRFVLNPFYPARIPYYAAPYELNPYSFFGVGVAENMADTQLLMNGFMRLAIDNAALSSNLIFEIDEANLAPGEDMKIYPGKIFKRQSGAPGQAIHSVKFDNVTQECLLMFDKARQLADESTGMPSYAHGMSGVMSTGRTAAGMSMLMSAAATNIKAVVKNIDDYLLGPLGQAIFAFNMQFNPDEEIVGDLSVIANGTESLMRSEIRSQKLMQFMGMAMNPMSAPFIKMDYILREIAHGLDIESEMVVNDPREAAIQAQVLGQMGQAIGAQQGAQPPGGPPSPSDPTQTGNGNIGPGAAPEPGAQGYTGAGGGNNGGNTQGAPMNG